MPETSDVRKKRLAAQRELTRTRAEKYVSFYTNNTEVGMSTWDVRLKFAQLKGGAGEPVESEDQGEVIMSVQHAKAVAILLANYVKAYEKENGELKIPIQAQSATEEEIPPPVPILPE